MKKLTKLLSLVLVVVFVFSSVHIAQPFIELPDQSFARVVQVIDVNSIRVRNQDGEEALVRLIGVSPAGSQGGIAFLQREIAGRNVFLTSDPGFETHQDSRWNYRYVHMDAGRHINAELVLSGLAVINEHHIHAELIDEISGSQGTAQRFGLGIWANEMRQPHTLRYANRLNINTATALQITQRTGASALLATNIVNFRTTAVYQQLSDLKFVPGMTREFFEENRHALGVSTNINTATEEELATIFTLAQARAIVNSRTLQGQGLFTSVQELVTRGLVSQVVLNPREPFLSITDDYEITFSRPGFRANLNTASHAQLTRAGATVHQANSIVQNREIMPIRNLQDLVGLHTFSITNHNLADNMRAFTNINTAPQSEIESLFGAHLSAVTLNATVESILAWRAHTPFSNLSQFDALLPAGFDLSTIAPFVYIDELYVPQLVNINTANLAQLVEIGFTQAVAQQILSAHGRGIWSSPSSLPQFIRNLPQENFSILTNVNTATAFELRSLGIDENIVSWIITYRNDQIFGSHAELSELFSSLGHALAFSQIQNFIIFR